MSVFVLSLSYNKSKEAITNSMYFHMLLNNCAVTNCFFSRTMLYKNIISDVLNVNKNSCQMGTLVFKNRYEKTRLNNKLNPNPTANVSCISFLSVRISCLFETSESLKNTCSSPSRPKEMHTCKKVINIEYSPYSKSLRVAFNTIFTKKTLPAPTIINSKEMCFFRNCKKINMCYWFFKVEYAFAFL